MTTDLSMPKTDQAIAILKAGVNAIPVAGGIVGSLMSDFIPTELGKRRDSLLLKLEEDFTKLSDSISEEYLKKPEFISLFIQSFKSAMATHQQEKINAYRAIILNSSIRQNPDTDELEIMLKITDSLTDLHIKLLKLFENPQSYIDNNPEVTARLRGLILGSISQLVSACLPGYDQELLKVVGGELQTKNLANIPFGTMMTSNGVVSPRLTEFGKKYLQFIQLPPEISRN